MAPVNKGEKKLVAAVAPAPLPKAEKKFLAKLPPPKTEREAVRPAPTSKTLTKYETALVVGIRAEMLARGAQPMVDVEGARYGNVYEIAEQELEAGRMPLIVVRTMPDGKTVNLHLAHRTSRA